MYFFKRYSTCKRVIPSGEGFPTASPRPVEHPVAHCLPTIDSYNIKIITEPKRTRAEHSKASRTIKIEAEVSEKPSSENLDHRPRPRPPANPPPP